MAKTLTQGLNLLRNKLDTASAGGVFGDELTSYLDEAQIDVVASLPDSMLGSDLYGGATVTPGSVPADKIYPWVKPGDLLRTVGLYRLVTGVKTHIELLPSGNDIRRKASISNYPNSTAAGLFYAQEQNYIHIWPATKGETYVWHYVKVPPALSTTQDFAVPDYLFEIVVNRALENALLQINKGQAAVEWKNRNDQKIEKLVAIWTGRPIPPYVQIPKQV